MKMHGVWLCLIGIGLAACGAGQTGSRPVYGEVAAWLDAHALPVERIAAPDEAQSALGEREILPLPGNAAAFALLAALDESRPDYVLVPNSLGWDGVRTQPWFIERYHAAYKWHNPNDDASPWTLFAYKPTPYDLGARVPVSETFATEAVVLRAYRLSSSRVFPGEPLYLTLYWDAPVDSATTDFSEWVVRVTLAEATATPEIASAPVVAQTESALRISNLSWTAEDRLTARYELTPPGDLPVGPYTVNVWLTHADVGQPIPVEGAPLRPELALTTVRRLPDVSQEPLLMDHAADYALGETLSLVGYDAQGRVAPGARVRVTLLWHTRDAVGGDYKVFVHLLSPAGGSAAQDDAKPVYWFYPTPQWQPGDYVRDEHILALPDDLARGDYTLVAGMYDEATGDRLPVSAAGETLPDGQVVLGVVQVR